MSGNNVVAAACSDTAATPSAVTGHSRAVDAALRQLVVALARASARELWQAHTTAPVPASEKPV